MAARRFLRFSIGFAETLVGILGGRTARAVIYLTVFEANHHPAVFREAGWPDGRIRPISIASVSRSVGMDVETTRRAAGALRRDGFCEMFPSGLVAAPGPALQALGRHAGEIAGLLAWAGASAQGPERLIALIGADPPVLAVVVARQWLRHTLGMSRAFENDYELMRMFGRVNVLNNGHLRDTDAAARFARLHPTLPDHLRRPALLTDIARQGDWPEISVRRRVVRMIAMGLCERRPGGVIVPERAVLHPAIRARFTGIGHLRDLLAAAAWGSVSGRSF